MKAIARGAVVAATGFLLIGIASDACVPTPILDEADASDAGILGGDAADGASVSDASGGTDAKNPIDAATPIDASDASDAASARDAADADAGPTVWRYSVVAGNGTGGYSGDTGQATAAQLGASYLSGVALDPSGNLFIADAGNACIRRVDPLGVITTYAGNGSAGYTGDNGPALSATMNGPSGIVADAAGNVYFSDFNNNAVRKVDTTGTITTYAALGSHPTGLAIDQAGNLYVAMFALAEILKIDTTKNVTVAVGSGMTGFGGDNGPAKMAKLSNPDGVWVDAQNQIYIVDNGNARIRKVDAAGTITTIAGNGTAGYTGDEGPAISAEVDSAYGVVADALGNVYFTEGGHNVVRSIDTAGIIHTIAGNKSTTFASEAGSALSVGLDTPGFLWIDGKGALYVSILSPAIVKLTP